MAFTFMPDHWIHGAVSSHAQNVAAANNIINSYLLSQTVHGPSHEVIDESQQANGDKYLPGNSK